MYNGGGNKLGMNRGGMNALLVKERLQVGGGLHVLAARVATRHVGRGDYLVAGQAPHVQLVHCQHARYFLGQVSLQLPDLDLFGHRLQQHQRRLFYFEEEKEGIIFWGVCVYFNAIV